VSARAWLDLALAIRDPTAMSGPGCVRFSDGADRHGRSGPRGRGTSGRRTREWPAFREAFRLPLSSPATEEVEM
jgi:hypothetical protein